MAATYDLTPLLRALGRARAGLDMVAAMLGDILSAPQDRPDAAYTRRMPRAAND